MEARNHDPEQDEMEKSMAVENAIEHDLRRMGK